MKFRIPKLRIIGAMAEKAPLEGGGCSSGDELYKNFDRGNSPSVVRLDEISRTNENYRNVLWTGEGVQLSVMSLPAGDEVGLERYADVDRFIKITDGHGEISMGTDKDKLYLKEPLAAGYAVIVPRGVWHNLKNTGRVPLKIYSLSAPKMYPYGTVQSHKSDAK